MITFQNTTHADRGFGPKGDGGEFWHNVATDLQALLDAYGLQVVTNIHGEVVTVPKDAPNTGSEYARDLLELVTVNPKRIRP